MIIEISDQTFQEICKRRSKLIKQKVLNEFATFDTVIKHSMGVV